MPLYQLYHLNAFSGHIDRVEDFHASDDVEAVHQMQSGPRPSNMELWRQGRKISRFDAAPNVFQVFWLEAEPTPKPASIAIGSESKRNAHHCRQRHSGKTVAGLQK